MNGHLGSRGSNMENTDTQRFLMPCTFTDSVQVMRDSARDIGEIVTAQFIRQQKAILNS